MKQVHEELARVVHYVFLTTGRRRISEDDWVRVLSLERKWLTPSKARLAADAARSAGLLRNAGARDYEKGLEAEGWTLPFDFRPDPARLEEAIGSSGAGGPPKVSLFRRIVGEISARTGAGETEIVAQINKSALSAQGLIRGEVAALAYARLQGVDVQAFYDEVDRTLRVSPSPGPVGPPSLRTGSTG